MLETALAAGIVLDGRRRDAGRPAADAGHRVHHVVDARRRGRRDQRVATTRTRTTASRSSRATASSCPTRSRPRSRRCMEAIEHRPRRRPRRARRSARRVRIEDARGRYIVFLQEHVPARADARRADASSSTAPTAPPTSVAPAVFEELGAKVDRDRREARRQEHQRRRAARCTRRTMAEAVKQHGRAPRHRARRRRRPRDRRRREGQGRRRRRGHGDVRDAACCAQGELTKKTLVATVMSNLGLERALSRAGGKLVRTAGRRPLRRRGDAQERLQPRRRAVGAPRLPRPRDHRRRHRRGAAACWR